MLFEFGFDGTFRNAFLEFPFEILEFEVTALETFVDGAGMGWLAGSFFDSSLWAVGRDR